jgi:small GTP-binding protein
MGDYAVGKTCIIRRYVSDSFSEDYKASIGVDITSQQLQFELHEVQLQIWDMSGQTDFRQVRTQFMSGTDCAILVFDLTRPSSLENISSWINEIYATTPNIPLVLVGNKADLINERKVDSEAVKRIVEEFRMFFYIETSAKSGSNVTPLFQDVAQKLMSDISPD